MIDHFTLRVRNLGATRDFLYPVAVAVSASGVLSGGTAYASWTARPMLPRRSRARTS